MYKCELVEYEGLYSGFISYLQDRCNETGLKPVWSTLKDYENYFQIIIES